MILKNIKSSCKQYPDDKDLWLSRIYTNRRFCHSWCINIPVGCVWLGTHTHFFIFNIIIIKHKLIIIVIIFKASWSKICHFDQSVEMQPQDAKQNYHFLYSKWQGCGKNSVCLNTALLRKQQTSPLAPPSPPTHSPPTHSPPHPSLPFSFSSSSSHSSTTCSSAFSSSHYQSCYCYDYMQPHHDRNEYKATDCIQANLTDTLVHTGHCNRRRSNYIDVFRNRLKEIWWNIYWIVISALYSGLLQN